MPEQKSNCHNWTAVHDYMPPRPPRLRVQGKCTFPTPGYRVELRKHVPPGINPRILILDKTVIKPTGPEPDVVTTVDVRFEEQTDVHYTEVLILPDQVTIKVEDAN